MIESRRKHRRTYSLFTLTYYLPWNFAVTTDNIFVDIRVYCPIAGFLNCVPFSYSTRKLDFRHTITSRERRITDRFNRIGNSNACQAAALPERPITDRFNGIGDGNAGQATATRERRSTDRGNGIANRHARQAAAIIERPLTDRGNGIGDDHTG